MKFVLIFGIFGPIWTKFCRDNFHRHWMELCAFHANQFIEIWCTSAAHDAVEHLWVLWKSMQGRLYFSYGHKCSYIYVYTVKLYGILKLKKVLVKFVCWCSAMFAVLFYIHRILCTLFWFLHWQSQKQELFDALCCIFDVAMLLLTGVIWTSHSSSITKAHKFIANTDKWKCRTVFIIKDKQKFSHVTFEAVTT